jgi:hypothetical protein
MPQTYVAHVSNSRPRIALFASPLAQRCDDRDRSRRTDLVVKNAHRHASAEGTVSTARVNSLACGNPPSTISWETGYEADDGTLRFGGWNWRYDLTPAGPAKTTVTLSYDWSAASKSTRELIGFPPFPPEHLANSLAHLAELVAHGPARAAGHSLTPGLDRVRRDTEPAKPAR